MAEQLTGKQFQAAVAEAVAGVLNVYREVDAMLRELSAALADGPQRFEPLIKRIVPGVSRKNPDARYLRNYVAAFFAPFGAQSDDEDEGDDEPEDGDDEDEDTTKKTKKSLTITTGGGLLIARAAIFDPGIADFEPNLTVGVLTRCRIDADVAAGTLLKVTRGRFKRIVRAVDGYRTSAGKTVRTDVPVQLEGKPKGKHTLIFDVPEALQRYPLFDVSPATILDIAEKARASWRASMPG